MTLLATLAILSAPAFASDTRAARAPYAEPQAAQDQAASARLAFRHWDAGVAHVLADRPEEARKEWKACLELDPKSLDCQAGLKLLGSEPEPEPSNEDQKRQATKHWNMGIIYFQKSDFAKARDEWLLCSQFDPKNMDCRTGLQRIDGSSSAQPNPAAASPSALAQQLYEKGDYEGARREAQRALVMDPSDVLARTVLRLATDRKPVPAKKSADSEESRRQAVKHWHSGIIYFQAGEYDKARDEWLLCGQFDPKNVDCQAGLTRIDSTLGGP